MQNRKQHTPLLTAGGRCVSPQVLTESFMSHLAYDEIVVAVLKQCSQWHVGRVLIALYMAPSLPTQSRSKGFTFSSKVHAP
jgi:hypothetical protein